MRKIFQSAFSAGYELMAAWSDLLDEINLYPVADADTGTNLRLSLAPLRTLPDGTATESLLRGATGNSGNIAGAYFSHFIAATPPAELSSAARKGCAAARQAVLAPQPGTMLSIFDALAEALREPFEISPAAVSAVLDRLTSAVASTANTLPVLKQAQVVDAGALGMFLFFEGFFKTLIGQTDICTSPKALFGDLLRVDSGGDITLEDGYCIDALLLPSGSQKETVGKISELGDHVVAVPSGDEIKLHLHAADKLTARENLSTLGELVRFDPKKFAKAPRHRSDMGSAQVHIATDAAGSLSRKTARELRLSLLDSYIALDNRSTPETLIDPEVLYEAMRQGAKASTAQASLFERYQCYASLTARYAHVIYLCVGSVYTGNHQAASRWVASRPGDKRMHVIDTGAASGRLGLIAHHTARYAAAGHDLFDVLGRIETIIPACDELVFLDQLKYLVAGGRISRTKGFFGDLLHLKPVIRSTAQGVQKAGVVKNRAAQIDFTVNYLKTHYPPDTAFELLLCHTDNQSWVLSEVKPALEAALPVARSILQPMSLTSGVHMGPGTWGVAFLPVSMAGDGNVF